MSLLDRDSFFVVAPWCGSWSPLVAFAHEILRSMLLVRELIPFGCFALPTNCSVPCMLVVQVAGAVAVPGRVQARRALFSPEVRLLQGYPSPTTTQDRSLTPPRP